MRYTTAIILTVLFALGCEAKNEKPKTPLPQKEEVVKKLSVKTPAPEAEPAPVTNPEPATPAAIEEEKGERPPAPDAPAEEPESEETAQPAGPASAVTPTAEPEPKPECGPETADTEGMETVCESDKVCDGNKCVDDPCLNVICSDGNTYGCQVAAAVHFRGFTTEEAVRRFLLKMSKKDNAEGTKLAAFNKALVKALRSNYTSAYSYTDAPAAVKEKEDKDLCEATQEPMTRLDGTHLMYRIKRHDAALRDINEDDAPPAIQPEPKVEAPKAPPKVMKAAPAPAAPAKLATPAVAPTPKGEERLVKLPVGLKK